jgi:protein PhnA
MAKGYEIHQARNLALQALGKDLTRRAKSKCELTGASGTALRAYEVPPIADEPELDRTLLLSEACHAVLERPKTLAGQEWRSLAESVWAEMPAVQVVSWRMLTVLATKEDWAREALDGVFLDDEIQAWANDAPLVP